jgi:hypothetical protein
VDAILGPVADAIGGVLNSPPVAIGLRLAAAYLVLVWLASALWSFVDMRRRSRNPIAPYAVAFMTIAASPLLFPLAILVHRVIRPGDLLSEHRLSELRSLALEAETLRSRCPQCNDPVEDDWLICPRCRRTLAHRCQVCGGTIGLDWPVCAWCGQDLESGQRPLRDPASSARFRVRA